MWHAGDMREQRACAVVGRADEEAAERSARRSGGEEADGGDSHVAFAARDLTGQSAGRSALSAKDASRATYGALRKVLTVKARRGAQIGALEAGNSARCALLAVLALGRNPTMLNSVREPIVMA